MLTRLTKLHSAIELSDAYEQPTIFLGFHFAAIEAGCMYYSIHHPVASLYTPMSDQSMDTIARTRRSRFGTEMIPRGSSRSEEHTSELQSLMRISNAVFSLKKKTT